MPSYHGTFTAVVSSSGTQLTTTNSGAISAGDCILAALKFGTSLTSILDSANGNLTGIDANDSHNHGDFFLQNSVASANGADTLTLNNGSTSSMRLAGDFFGGVATTGQPANHTTNLLAAGVTNLTTTNITNDPGGNVVWSCFVSATISVTYTAGTSNAVALTIGSQAGPGAGGSIATQYAVSTLAGTQNSTMTAGVGSSLNDDFFQVTLTGVSAAGWLPQPAFRLGPLARRYYWQQHGLGSVGPVANLKILSGTLTFVGSGPKNAINTGLSATLSFVGALKRAITTGLAAATLTFVGVLKKATTKGLAAATLTFSGALATLKSFGKILAGTLTFVGAQSRQTGKVLSASTSFAGGQVRAVTKGIVAGLSFVGTIAKQTSKALAAASASFSGILATLKQSPAAAQLILLTVISRSGSALIRSRAVTLSLLSRSGKFAIRSRALTISVLSRALKFITRTR